MKNIALTLCTFFFALTLNAQHSLEGIWNTGQDNTKVEISEEIGVFKGRILSFDKAYAKIGKQIIKDVTFEEGVWKCQLYATKKENGRKHKQRPNHI